MVNFLIPKSNHSKIGTHWPSCREIPLKDIEERQTVWYEKHSDLGLHCLLDPICPNNLTKCVSSNQI